MECLWFWPTLSENIKLKKKTWLLYDQCCHSVTGLDMRVFLFCFFVELQTHNFSKLPKESPHTHFGDHFNCLSSKGENCCLLWSHISQASVQVTFSPTINGFLFLKKGRMLLWITMFAQITSNPLLLHLIERKACNLIFRVNAHKHWRLLPYDYINSASKTKVLFAKLNENRGKKKHWNVSSEAILSITSAHTHTHTMLW